MGWGPRGCELMGCAQIEYFNKRRTLEMRQKATVDAAARARDENVANRGR